MDDNSIFIPGQILTVLIALFSYIITHNPLIKKKDKIAYPDSNELFFLF